jgi:hypothetical protein
MRRIHYDWLDAGERTQATVRLLSEQLRRFLDDQLWFENRRVMDILRSIESTALRLRDAPDVSVTTQVDGDGPTIALPMERPLYSPARPTKVTATGIQTNQESFDASQLFEQVYVDPARLRLGVRRALQARPQIGLGALIAQQPLEQGLAELVTYLSLTDTGFQVVFDDQVTEQVTWRDPDGRERVATLPTVTFRRSIVHSGESSR